MWAELSAMWRRHTVLPVGEAKHVIDYGVYQQSYGVFALKFVFFESAVVL